MNKDFGGLHDLSITKSAVTKVKAKQPVNFRSSGSDRGNTHEITHDTDSCLGIHVGGNLIIDLLAPDT